MKQTGKMTQTDADLSMQQCSLLLRHINSGQYMLDWRNQSELREVEEEQTDQQEVSS